MLRLHRLLAVAFLVLFTGPAMAQDFEPDPTQIGDKIYGSIDKQVLFTDGTTLAQDSHLTWDKATDTLNVANLAASSYVAVANLIVYPGTDPLSAYLWTGADSPASGGGTYIRGTFAVTGPMSGWNGTSETFRLNGVTGAIQSGANGYDGALVIYSEQGGTDYTGTFAPPASLGGNRVYTIPDATGTLALTSDIPASLTYAASGEGIELSAGRTFSLELNGAALTKGASGLSHATTTGYVHVPTGGTTGQLLQWASDGTAKWITMSADAIIADGGAMTIADPDGTTIDYVAGNRTFKVATGGIGATQLAASGIGAGGKSCTFCNVTFDEDGRATAASTGAEADTLQSVVTRGATSTATVELQNADALKLGKDNTGGTPNVPGNVIFYSGGDNAYYTVLSAPTQTATQTIYLPAANPAGTYLLNMTAGGQIGYDTSTYLTAEAQTLAAVTALGATTATASSFTGNLDVGADDDSSNLTIHNGSTFTMWDASDDTNVSMTVANGTSTLGLTGSMDVSTNFSVGTTKVVFTPAVATTGATAYDFVATNNLTTSYAFAVGDNATSGNLFKVDGSGNTATSGTASATNGMTSNLSFVSDIGNATADTKGGFVSRMNTAGSPALSDVLVLDTTVERSRKSLTTDTTATVLGVSAYYTDGYPVLAGKAKVNCDPGVVNAGDQLIISNVADGAARALNTNTDPRIVVGRALSTKAAQTQRTYESHTTADPGVMTITVDETWVDNQRVVLADDGVAVGAATAGGLISGKAYYVRNHTHDGGKFNFQLSLTSGGVGVAMTAATKTGTLTVTPTATVSIWLNKAPISPVLQANTWTGNQAFVNNLVVNGAAPVISACGAGPDPSVASGSDSSAGKITVGGTGPITSCTLALVGFTNTPGCVVTPVYDAVGYVSAESNVSVTFTFSADMVGQKFNYFCPGLGG